jgi:hypothetical protein
MGATVLSPPGTNPAPVGCGECGPHNHGGLNGSTNSSYFSFLVHVCFGRSRCSRCARVRTARPRWLLQCACRFKNTGQTPTSSSLLCRNLQCRHSSCRSAIALSTMHCTAGTTNGSISIARVHAANAALPITTAEPAISGPVAIYELSATLLHNRTDILNGAPLALQGDTFPVLEPIWVGTRGASDVGELVLSPHSVGFLVWPFARYEPCEY